MEDELETETVFDDQDECLSVYSNSGCGIGWWQRVTQVRYLSFHMRLCLLLLRGRSITSFSVVIVELIKAELDMLDRCLSRKVPSSKHLDTPISCVTQHHYYYY